MKYKEMIFVAFLLLMNCFAVCSQSLPSEAMGKPKIFFNEEMSFEWEDIAANRSWGELSDQPWKVYVDEQGVEAYSQPNSSSSVKHTCKFLESHFVAKIENGYALLFDQSFPSLSIAPNAKVCGWVSVDRLLLWNTCPRTHNQVYRKAMIVKDADEEKNYSTTTESSPQFSASSTKLVPNGLRAVQLEIFFVFKETSRSALLFRGRSLDDNAAFTYHHGWMRRSEFTNWNERLCFEKNFGDEIAGLYAAVYDDREKARNFKEKGLDNMTVIWKEKLVAKRSDPRIVRFPILDFGKDFIAQVATISQFSAEGGGVSSSEIMDCQNTIKEIHDKLSTINVVFVVDATSSMKEYFRPMAIAIQHAMKYDEMKNKKINFGAVVYRNYADASGSSYNLCEKKDMTRDYNSVAEWLSGRQCGSSELVDSYEAMFYGLDKAVDMFKDKNTCNFIVLVGDAGSKEPDPKGLKDVSIASKLAAKEVNFIAFQVNHPDKAAYDEFAGQIGRIMRKELIAIERKDITMADFKLHDNLMEYLGDNSWPLVSAGYKFAGIGKSEAASNLELLIEKKIIGFTELAQKNEIRFQEKLDSMVSGLSSGLKGTQATEDVVRRMEEMGLSREKIKTLQQEGAAVKLKGYTSRFSGGKQVFATSVFMTKLELDLLIKSLSSISSNSVENQRLNFQNALKKLALVYIGQIRDDMSIDDLLEAVNGLGRTMGGKSPLAGISIKNVSDPNKVPQRLIDEFIARIQDDVEKLKTLENDKSCYFIFGDERYYYILVEDMPLQGD